MVTVVDRGNRKDDGGDDGKSDAENVLVSPA